MIALLLLLSTLADAGSDRVVLRLEHVTHCGSWRVAIQASGKATGQLAISCGSDGPRHVTVERSLAPKMLPLQVLVVRLGFTDLDENPPEARPSPIDVSCVLEAAFDEPPHRVKISGHQLAGKDLDLKAFRELWRAVQELIPEPAW